MKILFSAIYSLFGFISMIYLFSACNPKCDPVGSITLSSRDNPAGYQILIQATPASTLLNKTISFGGVVVSDSAKKFIPDIGMTVKVPNNVTGSTILKIEDIDCADQVAFDFIVNTKEFYINNKDFVSPIMPEIIFPTLVAIYPPSINKSWVSPINTDYTFWFGIHKDSLLLDPQGSQQKKYFYSLNGGSFEKSTCSGTASLVYDPNKLYSLNPIYGYYDTTLTPRKIYFTVDRTSRGAGTEDYIADFIDKKTTNYDKPSFPKSGNCTSDPPASTGHMLLVTSKKTGRQTLVFQSSIGPM